MISVFAMSFCQHGPSIASAAERHGGLPRTAEVTVDGRFGRCSELSTTKSSAGLCGITWISCGRVDLMSHGV